jgi:hypothetical protein
MNMPMSEIGTKNKSQSVFMREMGHRKFEVKRKNYRLIIGEKVHPDTIIGRDYRTEENLKAGCHGCVATVYFNPMHDSLMVMIIETSDLVNGSES